MCAYCVGTFCVCLFVLQSTVHGIRGEKLPLRTSIDLELDLQASKTKYTQLHDEIRRLRELHSLLENAKAKGLKIQTFDVWLFKKKNKSLTNDLWFKIGLKKYNTTFYRYFFLLSILQYLHLFLLQNYNLYIFSCIECCFNF